ncbi:MAG: hypothetical protein FGM39_03995 [Phycisphaerales bacterium]|nr:hypothetical protein [Phycisphaerales bacterium]
MTVARRAAPAVLALAALAGPGCQQDLRRDAAAIDRAFAAGNFPQARSFAEDACERKGDDQQDRLVWWLAAGRTSQADMAIPESIQWYGKAYEAVRPYLDAKAEATVSEALVTTAVNQTMRIYRATPPERIMLCTLQGANYLWLGDVASARIELNRAADFQQDAVARYVKEVNAAQDQANAQWRKEGWDSAVATDAVARVRREWAADPATLGKASFANPFTSYLRAVTMIAAGRDAGDRQNARADLRAVQEMMPGMAAAATDIALIDGAGDPAVTWIFFLTGLAPDYREFRLDIPIPVGQVNYLSAAFPILRRRGDFAPEVMVEGEGGGRSELLADIDAMVEVDFNGRLPAIVTQEIISSASKAAATWAASQAAYQSSSTAGILVQIAGIAYQAGSTAADLRAWTTMPKQVALLRVPTPASGRILLRRGDGSRLCRLYVQPGAPNIALVTLPSASTSTPSVMMYRGAEVVGPPIPADHHDPAFDAPPTPTTP